MRSPLQRLAVTGPPQPRLRIKRQGYWLLEVSIRLPVVVSLQQRLWFKTWDVNNWKVVPDSLLSLLKSMHDMLHLWHTTVTLHANWMACMYSLQIWYEYILRHVITGLKLQKIKYILSSGDCYGVPSAMTVDKKQGCMLLQGCMIVSHTFSKDWQAKNIYVKKKGGIGFTPLLWKCPSKNMIVCFTWQGQPAKVVLLSILWKMSSFLMLNLYNLTKKAYNIVKHQWYKSENLLLQVWETFPWITENLKECLPTFFVER